MSLTKDYYTAAELAARQHRELLAWTDTGSAEPTEQRPGQQRRRSLRTLLDDRPARVLVGAWSSNFVHG